MGNGHEPGVYRINHTELSGGSSKPRCAGASAPTAAWWQNEPKHYELLTSRTVLEEVSAGDAGLAIKRMQLLAGISVLEYDAADIALANAYIRLLRIPPKAIADALHLALVVTHQVDHMLTWNCQHMANAPVRRQMRAYNLGKGLFVPEICTPEELMETGGEERK